MNEVSKVEREAHANVHTALAEAQGRFDKVKKGSTNTHFKTAYADLEDVVAAVGPALSASGIALSHHYIPQEVGNGFFRTALTHGNSGTSIECDIPLFLSKQDMQAFKAASTYAKRIGLESVTGVAPADDDDAEKAVQHSNPIGTGVGDAWRDGVLDSIPENASPRDKAVAFAEAIAADFAGKGSRALENSWNRHKRMIDEFETRFPELHGTICDAYENRRNELTEAQREKERVE